MQYASIVWLPYYNEHIERIESLQKRFLLRALQSLGWSSFVLPPYLDRLELIKLQTLQERRRQACLCFIFDLFSGRIDSPKLLASIPINAPVRELRDHEFLKLPFRRTNYGYHSPLVNIFRLFNGVSELFDFGLSRDIFRKRIRGDK
jgi:hypothetical protein